MAAPASSFSFKLEQLLSRLRLNDSALTTLDLKGNYISASGAIALAAALQHNSSLLKLDLSGAPYSGSNSIGASGVSALATALQYNSTLTSLDQRFNSIGDSGASELAAALPH